MKFLACLVCICFSILLFAVGIWSACYGLGCDFVCCTILASKALVVLRCAHVLREHFVLNNVLQNNRDLFKIWSLVSL
jgi:hypothetical protein